MDLTDSIAPKSDQINAEDLLTGPRTFTIEKVTAGSPDQPFNFHLVELPGRPYRPSKTMRRVMAAGWGSRDIEISYPGRRFTLYREPSVKFGGVAVGGIQISHMSDLDKPLTLALTTTRGKRAAFTVQPLPDAPSPTLSADQIAASTDVDWLRAQWKNAGPQQRAAIEARVAELTPPDDAA